MILFQVTILGLQSAAGQALNGSAGLVTGPPKEGRYPVYLFGNSSNEPLEPPLQRSIKAQNLQRREKDELYQQCCVKQAQKAFESGSSVEGAFMWLRGYSDKFPEDTVMNINYANMLLMVHKEGNKTPKHIAAQASAIMRRCLPHQDDEHKNAWMLVHVFCHG
mmetsp:Transcript_37924/g.59986  ORF Transcript_37924/g.59986 Transcript_37924/m.59986 type:complete len:163 (-) Transcript_37924:765-1253(-)